MFLFQNAPTHIVKAVYEVSFDPVVRIVLQSDDHSEMQVTFLDFVFYLAIDPNIHFC